MKTHLLALLVGGISVGTWLDAAEARACGACFHAGTDTSTSFVTDHRMVVSISPQQTVLWDQVKYTGNPSEFAWVLPVRDGTRVELARNEWIETLDQATSVSVQGPDLFCGGGGSGVGCGSSDMSATAGSGGYANDGNVQIVDQKVVGPYETVIVRSSSGEAIHEWLRINGFPVADSIAPILASYTKQGFDFLALKLRPQTGTQAMRPVRVVMPGAGATLPLRMVAGGIGAKVGLTLFVISEARHQAKNAPNAVVDRSRLAWDMATSRSNYRELAEQALAETGGRGWLTEYAGTPFMSTKQWYDRLYARDAEAARRSGLGGGIGGANLGQPLDVVFHGSCQSGWQTETVPCKTPIGGFDASVAEPAFDASRDAVADAHADADAVANDASVKPSPKDCTMEQRICDGFDDDKVALKGLHPENVWVTRLRAELSAEQCAAADLELEPAADRSELGTSARTQKFTDPNYKPCADEDDGCAFAPAREFPVAPTALALLGLVMIARGAKRRPRF